MIGGLLKSFPSSYTPNSSQVKLLKNIDQAFTDGYKFVVCNAPTGSGKSFISKTVSNVSREATKEFRELVTNYLAYRRTHGGGYAYEDECNEEQSFGCTALTITKALQDQYKELFNDTKVLKGKSNYQCEVDDKFTVELAPCLHLPKMKEECWAKNKCPYYEDRNKALTSTFSTLNYNMFFSLPDHLKKRQFIICDEAAELEDQLVKEFSCTVNFESLAKLEVKIRPFYSRNSLQVVKWINELILDLNDRIEELKDITNSNLSHNKKFIYVEAESSFDAKNAPIYCNTKVKLNYHNLKRSLPKIINQIKDIVDYHKSDKGIIHTHNNTITSFLCNKLNDSRYLIREPGVRNEIILEQHYNNPDPTVLVSPSMSHGVDLRDDLARFQIIVKAPYLPTKDKRIEKLMKDDFNWYMNKMLCSLIQSCGRGVRSHKDHCVTYILDGSIAESVVNNRHKLPKYFIDRFL